MILKDLSQVYAVRRSFHGMSRLKSIVMKTGNKEHQLMQSMLNGTAAGIKLKGSKQVKVSAVVNLESGNDHEKWIEIKPHTL